VVENMVNVDMPTPCIALATERPSVLGTVDDVDVTTDGHLGADINVDR